MASNEHRKQRFRSQLGIDATVQRESKCSDAGRWANEQLCDIGARMNPTPDGGLKYMGSFATHIYWNETLSQVAFVHQTGSTLNDASEGLVQTAAKDLMGTLIERYGHKRPTWRSGF